MKAVILAGGLGSRLSEETDRIPKPMVTVGDKPILWHIMKIYDHFGIRDFVVCLGYKGYIIKEFFLNYALHAADVTLDLASGEMEVHRNHTEPWRVTLLETGLQTMTGGRIKRALPHVGNETFCMTYGDGLANVDLRALLAFHASHQRLATVTATCPPGRFGALDVKAGKVQGFHEKPSGDALINGGFFVLEPGISDYIEGDPTFWERDPLERLTRDGQLMAFEHTGFWQPMDTLRERQILNELWESGQAPWKVWG